MLQQGTTQQRNGSARQGCTGNVAPPQLCAVEGLRGTRRDDQNAKLHLQNSEQMHCSCAHAGCKSC